MHFQKQNYTKLQTLFLIFKDNSSLATFMKNKKICISLSLKHCTYNIDPPSCHAPYFSFVWPITTKLTQLPAGVSLSARNERTRISWLFQLQSILFSTKVVSPVTLEDRICLDQDRGASEKRCTGKSPHSAYIKKNTFPNNSVMPQLLEIFQLFHSLQALYCNNFKKFVKSQFFFYKLSPSWLKSGIFMKFLSKKLFGCWNLSGNGCHAWRLVYDWFSYHLCW